MRTELPIPATWQGPLSEFSTWMRAASTPMTTQKLRRYHLRRFANTSGIAPYEAEPADLLHWLGIHSWKPNTKRSYRTTFVAFYTWAQAAGHMRTNPAKLLPRVASPDGLPRPAAEQIIRHALETAGERERLMIRLAAEAGLRCCEICKVNACDIGGERGDRYLIAHGKGDKDRVVPISDGLAIELFERAAASVGGWAFEGQIDGHLSASYVSKLISRALPKNITAHMLRHRFGTVTWQSTNDIRAVQELLGHASVKTTQVYTAIASGAKRSAVEAAAII